ncbi:MAG: class I SAM-dependent methyltransferase [Candidatus Rokubacteria bacterium]|nr:class I SAM-dependent methyltransferase [Candidatus Rokubacteria bacterium]
MSEAHVDRVRAQFGQSADAYVQSAGHAGGPDLDRLIAWGRDRRPARVLDVATGGGHTALAFAGIAERVVAYDVTEPMLRAARAFLLGRDARNVVYVAGDVESLPFAGGAFDLVTCRIAAHHFANVGQAVREIARVVRSGGSLLVQDILGHDDADAHAFITEVERRRDPSHVRAYRAREWNALLRGAGLTVIDETVVSKVRPWSEWTGRMRMPTEALRALEDFVRAASTAQREAFDFRLDGDRIESFSDRMLLLRADRD